ARAHLLECIRLVEQVGVAREGIFALEATVELLVTLGRHAEGARLDGAARAARQTFGTPCMRYEEREAASLFVRLAERLGEANAERLRAAGAELTLTLAISEAGQMLAGT
ncbi:MAG: hypothetical protein IT348_20180, partial [Candidatus Eisenbacteria bacterium]|nr:hypothetical protein [Candidatus Eisenbacteria bacterium]